MTEDVTLNERGTVAAMTWIAEHNTPRLSGTVFECQGAPFLIVSSQSDEEIKPILALHPLESWSQINDMKRLCLHVGKEPTWCFWINGKHYFASLY